MSSCRRTRPAAWPAGRGGRSAGSAPMRQRSRPRVRYTAPPRRSGGMVDAADSKSAGLKTVWVRVPPSAPVAGNAPATHRGVFVCAIQRARQRGWIRRNLFFSGKVETGGGMGDSSRASPARACAGGHARGRSSRGASMYLTCARILAAFLLSFLAVADAAQAARPREGGEEVVETFEVPGTPRDRIYAAAKLWALGKLNSSRGAIDFESPEEGILIGN